MHGGSNPGPVSADSAGTWTWCGSIAAAKEAKFLHSFEVTCHSKDSGSEHEDPVEEDASEG